MRENRRPKRFLRFRYLSARMWKRLRAALTFSMRTRRFDCARFCFLLARVRGTFLLRFLGKEVFLCVLCSPR